MHAFDSPRRAAPRRGLAWLCALGCVVAASAAHAEERSRPDTGDVQIQARDRVPAGERAGIRVEAQKEVARIVIKLTRDDGEVIEREGAIAAGEAKVFDWAQSAGAHHYKGEARVSYASGARSTVALEFDVTVAGNLAIRVGRGGFNLERKLVRFEATQGKPVRARVEVLGKNGQTLGKTERPVGRNDEGRFAVEWQAEAGDVAKVVVTAYDEGGAWSRVEVIPFATFIPHKEVVFASAKWNIRTSERPKLDETLALIREAVRKNAEIGDLRLYIAGYTDTVGGKRYNRGLSRRRARSIGVYFKRKGLRIPIYYQGFGEDALAVSTPDDTDEERNRRALYLLSNHAPERGKHFPGSDWHALR